MNARPPKWLSLSASLLVLAGITLAGCVKEVTPPTEEKVDAVRAASITLVRTGDEPQPLVATPGYQPQLHRPSVREAAAVALARIGEPAIPALIDTLNDPDPRVRAAAAIALARIGSQAKAAIPALTRSLKDKDSGVRREAARALGQMGPTAQEAVPALLEALRDTDEERSVPNTDNRT